MLDASRKVMANPTQDNVNQLLWAEQLFAVYCLQGQRQASLPNPGNRPSTLTSYPGIRRSNNHSCEALPTRVVPRNQRAARTNTTRAYLRMGGGDPAAAPHIYDRAQAVRRVAHRARQNADNPLNFALALNGSETICSI
ncbi:MULTISPECIES: hypothetical protein [unclassified Paraburkholderia]|uniref:hypothetical protein n=1 Tax=unclassified Paraburkholderia TaxID=2615204 RepID=UPI002AB72FE2|nr:MULTISPECIES: hypothetical protein [unclassified Paraburkholderia]